MTTLQILRAGVNKLPRRTSKEKKEIQKRITKQKSTSCYSNIKESKDITPARALARLFIWPGDSKSQEFLYWSNLRRELEEVSL